VSIAGRVFAASWPVRIWRTLAQLFKGVRLHPGAILLGSSRIRLGPGTSVGARCRFNALETGKIEVGSRCWFDSDVDLQSDSALRIGDGSTIQRRCSIQGRSRLGRNCILAPNVFISSGTHPFRVVPHLSIREQEALIANDAGRHRQFDRAVWIQDDCWLGTNVVVCPGVVIGKGSVVGANSVVLEDVAPYSVVAGVPAKVVGHRLDWRPPISVSVSRDEDQVYVLAGCRVTGTSDGVRGWIAAVDDPIYIALAHGPAVVIDYLAKAPVRIRVNGAERDLSSGRGSFRVLLTEEKGPRDCSMVRVELAATPQSTAFMLISARVEAA
jgi:acetyltransferase-like isoleucine patch superfamily enzyme